MKCAFLPTKIRDLLLPSKSFMLKNVKSSRKVIFASRGGNKRIPDRRPGKSN